MKTRDDAQVDHDRPMANGTQSLTSQLTKFSIFSLLTFVGLVGVFIGLSQLEFVTGCIALMALLALSRFVTPKALSRYCLIYIAAIQLVGFVLMTSHQFISIGGFSPSSYGESDDWHLIYVTWRPWIVFFGSFSGIMLGLLHHKIVESENPIAIPSTIKADCQDPKGAETTIMCPQTLRESI